MDRRKLIFLIVILAVIVGLGYYYFSGTQPKKGEFAQKYNAAMRLGRQNPRAGISELEKLIKEAPSKGSEALVKNSIARFYLGIDSPKAIQTYKAIAANDSYPGFQRASAVQAIADLYMLGSRTPTQKIVDEIFSGEPYKSFLTSFLTTIPTSSPYRVALAIEKVYEYSEQFYILPVSEYRIAERALRRVFVAKLDPMRAKLVEHPEEYYINKAKESIAKGDKVLSELDAQNLSAIQTAYTYWIRGMVLGYLSEFEKKTEYRNRAEESFRRSIDLLKDDTNQDPELARPQLLWASFYYASFLERTYGKSRENDIKKLLANITEPKSLLSDKEGNQTFYLYGFMRYLSRVDKQSVWEAYDYQSAIALAKRDPGFKELLKKMGWTI